MKAIVNAKIVLKDNVIPQGVLITDGEKIKTFGRMGEIVIPDGAEIIDAGNCYLGSGLIDIHTHAADNRWIFQEPEYTSEYMLKHGVTGVLTALYYNLNKSEYIDAVQTVTGAYEKGKFRNFIGLYMEGPYLNPNFGCEREKNAWKGIVKKSEYSELITAAEKYAKVWCIAPELNGIEGFVNDVKSRIPNVIFAVAHSEASPEQVEKYIPYGLKIGTHHTNATGTRFKYSECRGVCVDEAVNYNDSIYAELISDKMGLHVDPYMQRLVRKIKGDDKIILISDQFVSDGETPQGYEMCDDIHFDKTGEIAGSGLTLDIACRNFMAHTGCSVCDAFKFASLNPARVLGLHGVGEIAPDYAANLIIVNDNFQIQNVIFKGEIIK